MTHRKKILTITCHNVYNHGASLQEFALLKYLNNLGYDTKTINYTPDYLSNHFNFLSVDNPKFKNNLFFRFLYIILKFPIKLFAYPRKIKFDDFSKKYINETKINYKTNSDLITDVPQADIYICGSDQIWNSYFQNGKDPAFYLNFVPKDKLKISYAPSFAIDKIENSLKEFVKQNVKHIDAISVRETSGKKILNDLNINNVTQVLDPVFLLDKNKWYELSNQPIEKNYILIYDFDNNPLIKTIAQNIKKEHNYKIITLNKNVNYADKNYYLKGPQDFLSLIKNANFVLANSFHAVAFSLIFQKTILVFNRKDKINTRMRDLLASVNLNERLIRNFDFDYNKEIDYISVDKLLEKQIKHSKDFLKNALIIKK